VLSDFGKCTIPVSAKISIDSSGHLNAVYEYSTIDAKDLADFLVAGFGVDIEQIENDR